MSLGIGERIWEGLPIAMARSCLGPHPQGFKARSGWAGLRCCGVGPSPGTWMARTPAAVCKPVCAGSDRRCTAWRSPASELGTGWNREGRGLGEGWGRISFP